METDAPRSKRRGRRGGEVLVSITERIVTRTKPRLRRDQSLATEIKEVSKIHTHTHAHCRAVLHDALPSGCNYDSVTCEDV
jgi:hypothetical protein